MKFLRSKAVLVVIILMLLVVDANGWLIRRKQQKNKNKQRIKSKHTKTQPITSTIFSPFTSNVPNQSKIESQVCDMIEIKLKILSFIAAEKLLAKDVLTIWTENRNDAERVSLINKTLSKHKLKPFTPCLISSLTASTTKESGFHAAGINKNETECEPKQRFLSKIEESFLSNNLSFEKILNIYEETQTTEEKIKKLNKIIVQENLNIPLLPMTLCGFEITTTQQRKIATTTEPIDCNYLKDTSNRARIALVNKLEGEGWLPPNSVTNVMFGWITRDQMKKMVMVALVKSGRIAPICINQTITTPSQIKSTTTTKSQPIIAKAPKSAAATTLTTTATTTTALATKTSTKTLIATTTTAKTTTTSVAAPTTTTTTKIKRPNLREITLSPYSPSITNKVRERHKKPIKDQHIINKLPLSSTSSMHTLPNTIAFASTSHVTEAIPFFTSTLPTTTSKKIKQADEEQSEDDETWYRNFVMSHLPDPVKKLIESGKMPDYIEEAIFSGTHDRNEITQMIVDNEEVLRALLPQQILNMLQDRPVPEGIKTLFLSGKNESEIRKEIEGNSTILQELMSPSTYFFYKLFSVPRNRDLNVALSVIMIITLTAVMTSLGCTMTISEIKKHARKPKGVVIALISQFLIMPAASFGLTQIFGLKEFAAIAVLICGCCPGGNLSNILAYALKGDMNLSILMTSCSSVLGLGFMPLNIYLYSKLIIPLDSGQVVPFDKIIINIVLTIFPVAIGITVRHFKPHWVKIVMRMGALILIANSIAVGVISGVMFGTSFFFHFPLPVVACCAILPLIGYVFGFLLGLIGKESPKCVRTISVETGCQNVQLCSTVLKLAFDPILVGVLFLMPLIYMCFQVAEALLMILSFRLYHYMRYGKKDKNDKTSSEEKKSNLSLHDDDKHVEKIKEKASKNGFTSRENFQTSPTESEAQPFITNGKTSRLNSVRSIDSETFV